MLFFIKSQFSYCPLIWMFCSRTSMNKLNNIHKNCLRLVTSGYDSNFNELLESSHELSIHKTSINYLMMEVYKYLHGLSPKLMTDIFTLRKNPYNIHNIYSALKIYGQCVLEQMQQPFVLVICSKKVPIALKNSSLLEIFKAK